MSEFSFANSSAIDLLEHMEKVVVPPLVDERSLCNEKDRLRLMYELGQRELVEDWLGRARGPTGE